MQEIEEDLKEVIDDIVTDEKECGYYIYKTNLDEAMYINKDGKLITKKEYKGENDSQEWKQINLNRKLENVDELIENFEKDGITIDVEKVMEVQDRAIEERLTDWFQKGIPAKDTENVQHTVILIKENVKDELLKEILKTIKSEDTSNTQDMFILEIPNEYVEGKKILFQKLEKEASTNEIENSTSTNKVIPSEFVKNVILNGREEVYNNYKYKSEHFYIEPVKQEELFTVIQNEDITNIISYMYEEVNLYGNEMYVEKLNTIKQKLVGDKEQNELLEKVNELLKIEDRKAWSDEKWKTYNFAKDLEKIENIDFSKLDSEKISELARKFITDGSEILSNKKVKSEGFSNEVVFNYKQGMTLLNDKSKIRNLESLTNTIQEKIEEIDNYYNYMVETENIAFGKGFYSINKYGDLDISSLKDSGLNEEDQEVLKNRINKTKELEEIMLKNPYEDEEENMNDLKFNMDENINSALEAEYKKAGITQKDIENEFNFIKNNVNTNEEIEEESRL